MRMPRTRTKGKKKLRRLYQRLIVTRAYNGKVMKSDVKDLHVIKPFEKSP